MFQSNLVEIVRFSSCFVSYVKSKWLDSFYIVTNIDLRVERLLAVKLPFVRSDCSNIEL